MEAYLRDKYLKKQVRKKKRNRKGKIKVHDSEEDDKYTHNDMTEEDVLGPNFVSDASSEIPITVTKNDSMEIIQLSNEKKKIILESLDSGVLLDVSEDVNIKNNRKSKLKNAAKIAPSAKERKCYLGGRDRSSDKGTISDVSCPRRLRSGGSESSSDVSRPRRVRSGCSKSSSDVSRPRRVRSGCSKSRSVVSHPRRHRIGNHDSSCDMLETRRHGGKAKHKKNVREGTKPESAVCSGSPSLPLIKRERGRHSPVFESDIGVTRTVYRDREGKIISREEWVHIQKNEMEKKHGRKEKEKRDEHRDVKLEWGSGLVQKEIREKVKKENEIFVNKKNIINYDYDSDYDLELKMKRRKEDPMNIYIMEKKKNERLLCRYQSPYNRFNILAGYRWDGVIRGNGYEQRRYEALKLKQQQSKLAYMNGVSDLVRSGGSESSSNASRLRRVRSGCSKSSSDVSRPRRVRSGCSKSRSVVSHPRRHRIGNHDSSCDMLETRRHGGKAKHKKNVREGTKPESAVCSGSPSLPLIKRERGRHSPVFESDIGVTRTVYRDREGKIISREEWVHIQKNEMEKKHGRKEKEKRDEHRDVKLEWGSGLVQKEIREKVKKENEIFVNKKNIINYDYDSDYDLELKMKRRKEDPMNIYIMEKKKNERLLCRYQSPYNRFNILAGYRWDGVIRGNGYEQRRYEALKLKQQQSKLAYMNGVSDLRIDQTYVG
ncbi:pre-mRNA-splicing factor, putative [Plasmodium ovale curtisi]|uniref:Pre-mRNA-splicing factor, putative n=1 Tax=Plasmodium ovale curtisi TaxID=864141 RepID=A0A1A8WAD6_PLAOA|nr:pre-mRNA-splicing factor, putative [Plasmodium ovale curtisi]